jgi:hypothetical protein
VDARDRLPIGPTSILSHDGRLLGPADLALVERKNLGIRADGSRADTGPLLEHGDIATLGSQRKQRQAAA